jgi:hypothetical protein
MVNVCGMDIEGKDCGGNLDPRVTSLNTINAPPRLRLVGELLRSHTLYRHDYPQTVNQNHYRPVPSLPKTAIMKLVVSTSYALPPLLSLSTLP